MATRIDNTRPMTPPPEQKVLSDQEIDDILNEALGDLDIKKETPQSTLPPPLKSERNDMEEEMKEQMMQKIQSGDFDPAELQKELMQMIPQNPIDQIMQAVQLYEKSPQEFEIRLQLSLMMTQQALPENLSLDGAIILIPDSVNGGIKTLKVHRERLNTNDISKIMQVQISFMQNMKYSTEDMVFFDQLVRDKKAEYVTSNVNIDPEDKIKMKNMLTQLGVEDQDIDNMVNHKDITVVIELLPVAIFSEQEELIELYASCFTEAPIEDPFLVLIKKLSSTQATQFKAGCVAFLKKRLSV